MTAKDIKAMSSLDVVMEFECGNLSKELSEIFKHDVEFYEAVLEKVSPLRHSQGMYSRLCENLEETIKVFKEEKANPDNIYGE